MICSRCGRQKANKTTGMCTEDEIAHGNIVSRMVRGATLPMPNPDRTLPAGGMIGLDLQGVQSDKQQIEMGVRTHPLARRPPRGTA